MDRNEALRAYQDSRNRLKTLETKAEKEQELGRMRALEASLGLPSRKYNSRDFSMAWLSAVDFT